MTSFFSHPLVAPGLVELREYQTSIATEALHQNTLVIMPTGTGKTPTDLMVMAERLTPCPFCGCKSIKLEIYKNGYGSEYIRAACTQCHCKTDGWNLIEGAITAWNARHDPDEIPGWMRGKIGAEERYHWKRNPATFANIPYHEGFSDGLNWVLSLKRYD
jgi:hypothetical protein